MKSPAFQWYPKDHLASARVQEMSLAEEGAYRRLLDYCWVNGSIPADPQRCARIIGKGATVEIANAVLVMFTPDANAPAKLVHERLEEERRKQEHNSEARRLAAEARWNKRGKSGEITGKQAKSPAAATTSPPEPTASPPDANALQTECIASSSSIAIANTHTHTYAREDEPPAFQRGSPPTPPIIPIEADPAELPPTVEHFALKAHWEIYHVGLDLDTQTRVAAAVSDTELWKQALDFWVDNNYRGRSIGKIVRKYRELEAERNEQASSGKQRYRDKPAITRDFSKYPTSTG